MPARFHSWIHTYMYTYKYYAYYEPVESYEVAVRLRRRNTVTNNKNGSWRKSATVGLILVEDNSNFQSTAICLHGMHVLGEVGVTHIEPAVKWTIPLHTWSTACWDGFGDASCSFYSAYIKETVQCSVFRRIIIYFRTTILYIHNVCCNDCQWIDNEPLWE